MLTVWTGNFYNTIKIGLYPEHGVKEDDINAQ
jgi:hypothetical protein